MINQEVRKDQFNHLKKRALLVFSTALRGPLLLMLGCGTTVKGISVHDHGGQKWTKGYLLPETFDESTHGKIKDWREEGEEVNIDLRGKNGSKPIHRHPKHIGDGDYDGYLGAQEFKFE